MNHVNPVTRLLSLANTSEKAFRDRFRYSKQFMVDVTAGTYTRLSDSVHLALKELLTEKGIDVQDALRTEYGADTLDEAYEIWQIRQRAENRDKFVSIAPNTWGPKASPAYFFVKNTSGNPTRFSKDLKVPPQQVRRWVNGTLQTTPASIVAALRQIGYPWTRELIENQRAWLEEHS